MTHSVHLVPLADVNWADFSPLNPARGYIAEPPPVEQCAAEVEKCVDEFRNVTDGKVVYAVHSGTYCRRAFYEEPFLSHYRRAIEAGGEVCVHTHEEIAGKGTRNAEQDHVKGVIRDRIADLEAAGIRPTSYRGGLYAYMDYLTPFLESCGLHVDLSAAPGVNQPAWDAVWAGTPFSAYYLDRQDHLAPTGGPDTSRVLEIPLGADGIGAEPVNLLYVDADQGSLEHLQRVWQAIIDRTREEGRPGFVHALFHTSTLGRPALLERFRRFMDHAARNGARFCTPTEAKAAFDAAA